MLMAVSFQNATAALATFTKSTDEFMARMATRAGQEHATHRDLIRLCRILRIECQEKLLTEGAMTWQDFMMVTVGRYPGCLYVYR